MMYFTFYLPMEGKNGWRWGFEDQVISACDASPVVVSVAVIGSGITWLRLRAYLVDESFIEAFYNEETQKVAFARIKDGNRIFGADNTGDRHGRSG